MAEQIEYKWTVDDGDVQKAAESFLSVINMAIEESKDFEEAFQNALDSGSNELKEAARELQAFTRRQQKAAASSEKQRKSNEKLRASISEIVGELEVGGRSLSDWVDLLGQKQKAIKGVTAGIGGTNKALRAFKIALASTGVGLIVIALGSLVALLTRTQKGIDFVNRVMAGLTTTINVIIDRLAIFGEGVVQLFKGKFTEAVDTFTESVSGVADELARENRITQILERDKLKLRDRQRELNVAFAEGRGRIEELRLAAEDESRGATERANLLREAVKLEQELGEQRIDLAEENLRIIATQNALSGENQTAEQLNQIAEAEAALGEIREDVAGRQAADAAAIQALLNEERERVIALREEYRGFLDDLSQRVSDARITELTGIDRLIAEKELALQEVQRFADDVKAAALAAGQELPPEFSNQVQALIQEVETEFRRAADNAIGGRVEDSILGPLVIDPLRNIDKSLEQEGAEAVEAFKRGAESKYSLLEEINIALFDAFGIDEAGRQQIADAVGSITDSFLTGIDAGTQAQITQQDVLLDAVERRIDETQRLLDIELDRQAAGRANNVADLQAKLEEENQVRDQAEAKRLELEKKAARQRLIQQQAEQVSNYILAATRLAATESFKGLPGIFTAAAGVTLLFSLIKQARAQSQQFEIPQFWEGTPYVLGPGTGTSDSIPAMLSRGERVMPYAVNAELGGRQVTDAEIVRLFNLGKAVEQNPYYHTLGAAIAKAVGDQKQVRSLEGSINLQVMQRAYEKAANASAKTMIEYWKTRPVEKVASNGGRLTEWYDGGVLHQQIVKPKS